MPVSAEEFLDLLQQKDLVPADLLAGLRQQVAASKAPVSADRIARLLIAKGMLTPALARRQLTAEAKQTAQPTPGQPQSEPEEELTLAPLDDEPQHASLPPRPPVPGAGRAGSEPAPAPPSSQHTPAPAGAASLLDEELPPLPEAGPGGAADAWLNDPAFAAAAVAGSPLLPLPQKRAGFGGLRWWSFGQPVAWRELAPVWIGGGVLLGVVIFAVAVLWSWTRPTAEELLDAADGHYQSAAHAEAIAAYDAFLQRFPDHPQSPRARVRRGISRLALLVERGTDWQEPHQAALEFVAQHSGEPEFAVEAPPKLAALLPALAKGLARQAEQRRDPELVAQAWQIMDLIDQYLADADLQAERLDQVELSLGLVARDIARGGKPEPSFSAGPPLLDEHLPESAAPAAAPSPPKTPAEPAQPEGPPVPAAPAEKTDAKAEPPQAADKEPAAPAEEPLFEQDPFDRITLTQAAGGAVLNVQPLSLPDRQLPENSKPTDKLTLRLLDQPEKLYEVAWGAIQQVQLFEQMILAKANELVAAGRLDEAPEYFRFLEANHPRLPGLGQAVEACLYEEAKLSQRRGDYRGALAMLREIHRRNPQRLGLDRAMGAATEKLLEQYVALQQHPAARTLVRNLAACFPAHALAASWEAGWQKEADALLADAKAAAAAGQWGKAAALCRQIERVWPATPGAKELAQTVHGKYPRVVVGVLDDGPSPGIASPGAVAEKHGSAGAGGPSSGSTAIGPVADWSARRRAPLLAAKTPGAAPAYVIDRQIAAEVVYLGRGEAADGAVGPKEIVERPFADGAAAVRALRAGRVLLLDRVPTRDLARLCADRNIVVEPYAMPWVHALIPNLRKPLTGHRGFRRALVLGIQRQAILDQLLCGAKPEGCRLSSGPFAAETAGSPLPDAHDKRIEPRAYDPQLAMVLAEAARRELFAAAGQQAEPPRPWPPLVLAHPAAATARSACTEIRRQLRLIGIDVELRETSQTSDPLPDHVDLLYAELAMWNLPADALRLLGDAGPAGGCTPMLGLALRRLGAATDESERSVQLREIHRALHDEVLIVPLWQWVEHLAYRADFQGIQPRTVTLYQDVAQWRPAFAWAVEDGPDLKAQKP